jgi:hypothetical protein
VNLNLLDLNLFPFQRRINASNFSKRKEKIYLTQQSFENTGTTKHKHDGTSLLISD